MINRNIKLKIFISIIFALIFNIYISYSDEKIDYIIDDNLLTINISNLNANCCSAYSIDYHINYNNGLITFTLSDTTTQKCRCNCNYDFQINLGPLPQGKYTIQILKEELTKFNYSKDKRMNLGRKEISINSPHPKSPLQLEFKQSTCKNSSETQSNDEYLKDGIEVFSNSTIGSVSIKFNIKETENINIKILNFLGKELEDYKFKNIRSGTNTVHLDLSDKPPGMYIGKILNSTGLLYRFKLIWSK